MSSKSKIICAINQEGTEFLKSHEEFSDIKILYFHWKDISNPATDIIHLDQYTFYKDMPSDCVDLEYELRELIRIDRAITYQLINDVSFSRLLRLYFIRSTYIKSKLISFFMYHYSAIHQIFSVNKKLHIYFISNLNNTDDFILMNCLLYTIEDIIGLFFTPINVTVTVIGKEINSNLMNSPEERVLLFQNLNFFYLNRKRLSYRLQIIQIRWNNNKVNWQLFDHLINQDTGLLKLKNQKASVILPMTIYHYSQQEKQNIIQDSYNQSIMTEIICEKDPQKYKSKAFMQFINRQIYYCIKTNKKKLLKKAKKLFKSETNEYKFIEKCNSIIQNISHIVAKEIIEAMKITYNNGALNIISIENITSEADKTILALDGTIFQRETNITEHMIRYMSQSRFQRLIKNATSKQNIPINELNFYIDNKIRYYCVKQYKRKMEITISKLKDTAIKSSNRMAKFRSDNDENKIISDKISKYINDTYFTDSPEFKKSCGLDHNKIYQIAPEIMADCLEKTDKILTELTISNILKLKDNIFLLWKTFCFPWIYDFLPSIIIFSYNDELTEMIVEKLSNTFTHQCKFKELKKAKFSDEYVEKEKIELPIQIVKKRNHANNKLKNVIYMHIGFFQLETLLFKEYSQIIHHEVKNSKMLMQLIKNSKYSKIIQFLIDINGFTSDNLGMIHLKRRFNNYTLDEFESLIQKYIETNKEYKDYLKYYLNMIYRIKNIPF